MSTANSEYWWNTTGHDFANMLHEANYPEEAQRQFLTFYRDNICPQLGTAPNTASVKSGVGKDGDCFEYSFEFKGTTSNPAVRFGVDLSPLRPVDATTPLSITGSEKVIAALRAKTPGFSDTWYHALRRWFVYAHSPTHEQDALIVAAGHQMSLALGCDIHRHLATPDALPMMAKVYFPPCFAAAAKGITRWNAVRSGIRQLPRIDAFPNILRSLGMIDEYLSTQPKGLEDGVRYLATDFLVPEKTRLKVYMRCAPGESFEGIWDFYTLGGRIEGLEEDKEKFRDLMRLMGGIDEGGAEESLHQTPSRVHDGSSSLAKPRVKTTTIYFSLSAENPGPAPKIGFFPGNTAENDEVIAKGLDAWLSKYGWYDGGKTLEERVRNVFTHRTLAEKTGIFTFINIGRKEHPAKKDISIQAYVTPELYSNPRSSVDLGL